MNTAWRPMPDGLYRVVGGKVERVDIEAEVERVARKLHPSIAEDIDNNGAGPATQSFWSGHLRAVRAVLKALGAS